MKISLHVRGWAEVEVDPDDYEYARDAHHGGDTGRLDKLLQNAIASVDTEVTVVEPDGVSYDL